VSRSSRTEFLLGNGAIALGLLEAGCQVISSYPGTPSSEILPEAHRIAESEGLPLYVEWSVNEKVALDVAFAAAVTGKRAACCMKQVGLNVALDSLMSAAYMGTVGGLVVISCDDPGPHSSQTEQDTRLLARAAKVPVFDPSCPEEAREMVRTAMEISEEFRIPVILRPAIRVCHARQDLCWDPIPPRPRRAEFQRNPTRWAATPRFRLKLHEELNGKLKRIEERFATLYRFNGSDPAAEGVVPLGIIAGGVPFAVVKDLLEEEGREKEVPVLKIGTPYPFPESLAEEFLSRCEKVLVLEETDAVMEVFLRDRRKVWGRLSGHVPWEGELIPQRIAEVLDRALRDVGLDPLEASSDPEVFHLMERLQLPVRRPTLCPGCPHRAAFYAIRKALPKAIFTSDIGCYTLGLNLGAVDTCLDMGAAITMASGFSQAFAQDGELRPIVATIGDSTFYHSGTAGLLNAVYNDARFLLVILDNQVTAMTGMQPTPGLGVRADGSLGKAVPLERVVEGCGVQFLRIVDPYEIPSLVRTLKEGWDYVREPQGGIAVIIARHPCVLAYREEAIPQKKRLKILETCKECRLCIERFECPAILFDEEAGRAAIDPVLCAGCGVCLQVCPNKSIVEVKEEAGQEAPHKG